MRLRGEYISPAELVTVTGEVPMAKEQVAGAPATGAPAIATAAPDVCVRGAPDVCDKRAPDTCVREALDVCAKETPLIGVAHVTGARFIIVLAGEESLSSRLGEDTKDADRKLGLSV